MQAIGNETFTYDNIILFSRELPEKLPDESLNEAAFSEKQLHFIKRYANQFHALLTTRELESTGEVSLESSRLSSSLDSVAESIESASVVLSPVASAMRYAGEHVDEQAQERRQSLNAIIQTSLTNEQKIQLSSELAVSIAHSLAQQLEALTLAGVEDFAKLTSATTLKQAQHYQLQPLASEDEFMVVMGFVYQFYLYTFYPELGKVDDFRFLNYALETEEGKFWTLQGILARTAIRLPASVAGNVYHLANETDVRGCTRIEKYGIRQALCSHEHEILQLHDRVLPGALSVGESSKKLSIVSRLRRKIKSVTHEAEHEPLARKVKLDNYKLLHETIDGYLETYREQQAEFRQAYEKYQERHQAITAFIRERDDLLVPECWDTQPAQFCVPRDYVKPRRATGDELTAFKHELEEVIPAQSELIDRVKNGYINLTAIWLDIRGQHYISEPGYYHRAKKDKEASHREMANMVETFVIEHELSCCPSTDFSSMVSSHTLNAALNQVNRQAARRPREVGAYSGMAKSFHWLANARVQDKPQKCSRKSEAQLKNALKENMPLAYQLANAASREQVNFGERVEQSRTRLQAHRNQRLENMICVYHKLNGKSLGAVALANHGWFKSTIGRHIGKLIRYLTKVFVGKKAADALSLDLTKATDRATYRSEYVTPRNRGYVEHYWYRAVKAQIKKKPSQSLELLLQAKQDESHELHPHIDALAEHLPPKYRMQLLSLNVEPESSPAAIRRVG